ncbi:MULTISPECIES: stage III sporulation protein AE [Clostridia]|uniref:Sporulation protein n=1 Tax=Lacrimispora celerecrescens TaxID=29354 RepID=A0A084JRZ3_9FIRM|nr:MULTISPECIES: stage III sporulation protein AE [Clostridia]KEZ91727.1 sporulation protein [Lacrimispora celerecrescens]MBW4848368.1 stage III sporulation protein AE [Lachnospiraceae bacterium]MSS09078.1 sporulation protein [Clostridium sp. WB02_MRS01]
MKRTAFFLLCLISLMLLFFCKDSLGAEETSGKEASVPADLNLDQYDLTDIQNFLDQSKGDQGMNLSFKTLMKDLMDGKLNEVMGQVGKALKDLLVGEVRNSGHMMGQIMVLGIIGAVFSNFSSVFTGSQISETGFFVTYLLLFTYLAASFFTSVTITGNVVGQILDFTKVLMPAYFLAAAFAGSSASAAASYEFTLFVIVVAQWLLGQVLLALIRVYALLVMAGHIAKEEMLSKLTELLEQVVSWSLKTLVGVVLGFHLIQSMVLPYVDSMKTGAIQKLIGAIPGIGQGVNSVAQMVLGSGVLIKNTIGAAGIIVLLILSVIPLIKLAVLMVLYQCVAALLQPVCDKRIVSCISEMAKGHKMLLSVAASAVILFVVTIALVCASTNVTYYTG